MKAFEMPRMTVVHLIEEDIVSTSECTESYGLCYNYHCDDCGSCTGTFSCLTGFECHSYYGNGN